MTSVLKCCTFVASGENVVDSDIDPAASDFAKRTEAGRLLLSAPSFSLHFEALLLRAHKLGVWYLLV